MMKRHVRQFSRKIERKFSAAKSKVTSFGRSNSYYNYPASSIRPTSAISSHLSDSDDDGVFEATSADELSTDGSRRPSVTLIPCEFCNVQQNGENLTRHQLVCPQNPASTRRRRNLTAPPTTTETRRRAISDYVSSSPSAPPRSRSPSPTEGFSIPNDLVCPIMHSLFRDPVVASDGHTYERSAITNWLRTAQISPITREAISIKTLNPNRVIKKMADDFRTECQQKRLLYKYKLDVDIKRTDPVPDLKTNTKTFYQAKWTKQSDLNIILLHLTGDNAEKIAEINSQIALHPNIVQTFGRVEHNDSGILLLQEYLPTQTLSRLIKDPDRKFSVTILDTILYQISSALQHLANLGISHGNLATDNVFVYQFDETPENILVKITNIGDYEISNNNMEKNLYSEKSDVYAFGILARELYSLELAIDDQDLIERQTLIDHCLGTDPNERLTFNELTKSINNFMLTKKFLYPALNK